MEHKEYTIQRPGRTARSAGSTSIIPAVPLRERSNGHRSAKPLKRFSPIRLYALVLATMIAHPLQGTLRAAISALNHRTGTWLARIQTWWAPPLSIALSFGVLP